MIQITPQMRVLVAIEPVDFRRYAANKNMRSARWRTRISVEMGSFTALHNGKALQWI